MRTVLILGFVSLLTDISSEMDLSAPGPLSHYHSGASPAIVGIIEGIAESLASLLKAYSGYVSDKVQRRKPLAILGLVRPRLASSFCSSHFVGLGALGPGDRQVRQRGAHCSERRTYCRGFRCRPARPFFWLAQGA